MSAREELHRRALRAALRVRVASRVPTARTCDVFKLCEDLGVEVRFVDIPSMEGAYLRMSDPTILVSAHRPAGRQVYTCAHELGHHVFNHGHRIDELRLQHDHVSAVGSTPDDPDEALAQSFAAYLLMPKTAVEHAFAVRGWRADRPSPDHNYIVARQLGVGFSTLVTHMWLGLRIISRSDAERILGSNLVDVRTRLFGRRASPGALLVDQHWNGLTADLTVGEVVRAPVGGRVSGHAIARIDEDGGSSWLEGAAPGLGQLNHPDGWACFLRVARPGFVGRSVFRHCEDPDAIP